MEPIIKYVVGEMRVIAKAPATFFVALLVLGAAIWWAMDWRYGRHLSTKDGEISLLTRQRDDYKDKLGGASPDEAKARIDTLEKQLDERLAKIEPRHLSQQQIEIIRSSLARLRGSNFALSIQSDMSCTDCAIYAADFQSVISETGWAIKMPKIMAASMASPKGLAILTPDRNNPLPEARALIDALTKAQIPFDLKSGSDFRGLPGIDAPKIVALLITARAAF
jgi:hypothetical protein